MKRGDEEVEDDDDNQKKLRAEGGPQVSPLQQRDVKVSRPVRPLRGGRGSSGSGRHMDFFKSIFAFVYNAARRKKVPEWRRDLRGPQRVCLLLLLLKIYCLGRGFTSAKRYLQQRGWINLGKGVSNSKVKKICLTSEHSFDFSQSIFSANAALKHSWVEPPHATSDAACQDKAMPQQPIVTLERQHID